MNKMHATYQPNTYYIDFTELPELVQESIANTPIEYENSSYTVYNHGAFKRGTCSIDGVEYDWEYAVLGDNGEFNDMSEEEFMNAATEMSDCTYIEDYGHVYLTLK